MSSIRVSARVGSTVQAQGLGEVTGVRRLFVAALPVVLLVVSPERELLSWLLAGLYLAVALGICKFDRDDRVGLVYAFVSAAFVLLQMLRVAMAGPWFSLDYGLSKGTYFVGVVLPMSIAVMLLVRHLQDLRPALLVWATGGSVLAILTLILRRSDLLAESRYTWQGNLMALSCLLWLQCSLLGGRKRVAISLALVSAFGTLLGTARGATVVLGVGVLVSALYWIVAEHSTKEKQPARAIWISSMLILVAAFITFVVLLQLAASGSTCNCAADRYLVLLQSAGYRDQLVSAGLQLFLNNPIVGSGLGSYVGSVQDYLYPHDIALEVGAEMGGLGIAVLLAPLAVGWVRLFLQGSIWGDRDRAMLTALIVTFSISAAISGDLPSDRVLWVVSLVALRTMLLPGLAVKQVDNQRARSMPAGFSHESHSTPMPHT